MFPIITPLIDIYFFSLITTIIFYYLEKYFFKTKPTKEEQNKNKLLKKELRKLIKEKNTEKAQKLQQQLMKTQLAQMQKSFTPKTVIFRMIPYSFFIIFLRKHYQTFGVILNLKIFQFKWLGAYFIFSILNSIIINKILKEKN